MIATVTEMALKNDCDGSPPAIELVAKATAMNAKSTEMSRDRG